MGISSSRGTDVDGTTSSSAPRQINNKKRSRCCGGDDSLGHLITATDIQNITSDNNNSLDENVQNSKGNSNDKIVVVTQSDTLAGESTSVGVESLCHAALCGDTAACRSLVSKGVNVSCALESGTSPLHLAAVGCHDDCVAWLLSVPNIQPMLADKENATPLHRALCNFNYFDNDIDLIHHKKVCHTIQLLVDHASEALLMKDRQGRTPLHVFCEEYVAGAIQSAHMKSMIYVKNNTKNNKNTIKNNSIPTISPPSSLQSIDALYKQICDRLLAIAAILLSTATGRVALSIRNKFDMVPLHSLIRHEQYECYFILPLVEKLLIDRSPIDTRDWRGRTPLRHAIELSSMHIAHKLIINSANVNISDDRGWTVMHWICDAEAPALDITTLNGNITKNRKSVCMKHQGLSVFRVNQDSRLCCITLADNVWTLPTSDNNATPSTTISTTTTTAVTAATTNNRTSNSVISASNSNNSEGKETSSTLIVPSQIIKQGHHPSCSISSSRRCVCAGISTRGHIAASLLSWGANLSLRDNNANTPLHLAVASKRMDVCRIIIAFIVDKLDINLGFPSTATPVEASTTSLNNTRFSSVEDTCRQWLLSIGCGSLVIPDDTNATERMLLQPLASFSVSTPLLEFYHEIQMIRYEFDTPDASNTTGKEGPKKEKDSHVLIETLTIEKSR